MRLLAVFILSFFIYSQAFAGVTKEIIKNGDGTTYPKAGQKVTVDYTGTLQNGTKFDSSVDRGQPFSFVLGSGKVIKGWEEGIPQMTLGEEAKLTITPDYAYGSTMHGNIPANSTLIFNIKLLKVE